jgi:LPPG:FO 2-phospho-L-lactate transferase
LTVLAGGVGAAKFLRGLIRCIDPAKITVIVNTADDDTFFGLAVSPDLDTITYTLADVAHRRQGWGLDGDRFHCLEALKRFYPDGGWFRLGDADLATHVYRTDRLSAGARLSTVTAEITRAFGVDSTILPMTDYTVRSIVITDRGKMSFQEYLVKHRARPKVEKITLKGITGVQAAPGVLRALREAELVVIAPSNPILSIQPILAVEGVKETLIKRDGWTVAISPLVGGRAVSGPLVKLLDDVRHYPPKALSIAQFYYPFLRAMVIDRRDWARDADEIDSHQIMPIASDLVFSTAEKAAAAARTMLRALDVR